MSSITSGTYNWKHIKNGSKYTCVQKKVDVLGGEHWIICVWGYSKKEYPTERDAAIAVDKIYISKGKEPINILKRK